MWEEVGLLGRDKLLTKKIVPRLRGNKGFLLTGSHGIGKTALLQWVKKNGGKKKMAMVSATWTVKEILTTICVDWELVVTNEDNKPVAASKWQVKQLENAIFRESEGWLLIDDINRATPAQIKRFKVLRENVGVIFIAAGVPPFRREELKRLLHGLPEIEVGPIDKKTMVRLAKKIAQAISSNTPIGDAVHSARGCPHQLFLALQGEVTKRSVKNKGEEIDLSPLILIAVAAVMVVRFVAKTVDSTSLYMVGGLGMALAAIVKFYLFRGMEK